MTEDLRRDLIAIILEEAWDYRENFVRTWLDGKPKHNLTADDQESMERANRITQRIDARCGKIEG